MNLLIRKAAITVKDLFQIYVPIYNNFIVNFIIENIGTGISHRICQTKSKCFHHCHPITKLPHHFYHHQLFLKVSIFEDAGSLFSLSSNNKSSTSTRFPDLIRFFHFLYLFPLPDTTIFFEEIRNWLIERNFINICSFVRPRQFS